MSGSWRRRNTTTGDHRPVPCCCCCGESVSRRTIRRHEYSLTIGIAGAGKTYIASRVIDSFLSNRTSEKLAYFYCNRAEENRRDPETIFSTFVHQLAQTEPEERLLQPVLDVYQDREKKGQNSRLSLVESQELLVQLADIHPRTTICIDALHEVESSNRLKLLKSLRNSIERRIWSRFLQPREYILLQFKMFPRIELQPDDNVSDINQFVKTSVQSAIKEE